jgi:hypothetical protein
MKDCGWADGGVVFGKAPGLTTWATGALVQRGYELWGDRWTRDVFPGHGLEADLGEYEPVSCHDFSMCATYSEDGAGMTFKWHGYREASLETIIAEDGTILQIAGKPVPESAHSGIHLGRTRYGQDMVLFKLNVGEPVTVRTGVWLNRYFNGGFGNAWYTYGAPDRR